MALEITKEHEPQGVWVSDRRLWLTADKSQVVEDGEDGAAFLLCTPGRSIPKAQAAALGLVKKPVEESPADEPEVKEQEKPEDKQRAKPANKARKTTKRRKRT